MKGIVFLKILMFEKILVRLHLCKMINNNAIIIMGV